MDAISENSFIMRFEKKRAQYGTNNYETHDLFSVIGLGQIDLFLAKFGCLGTGKLLV